MIRILACASFCAFYILVKQFISSKRPRMVWNLPWWQTCIVNQYRQQPLFIVRYLVPDGVEGRF